MSLFSICLKPFGAMTFHGGPRLHEGMNGGVGFLRHTRIGRYASGDYSMAIVQGNQVLEDQCQIMSGPYGTFVGIYDGHGGPEASRYICNHLFRHLQRLASESNGRITHETVERAFLHTEEEFSNFVSELWRAQPHMATVGSCCLVGVISQKTLFVGNVGDSRVVLGNRSGAAIQLSSEHNAKFPVVRKELKDLHPHDPHIVVLKHGVWRVKGIIQVSRSIGDVYMKNAEYNKEPIGEKFRVSEPMNMPIMTAKPSVVSHSLHRNDSFLIFASDGLWEHLNNEKAVEIVSRHPHSGSAKRLVKAALREAARKREIQYSDIMKIDQNVRRHFHDDITVIILFLDHRLITSGTIQDPPLSIRSALDH